MPYIYSTLSCDVKYTAYMLSPAGIPQVTEEVLVRGKANINYMQSVDIGFGRVSKPALLTMKGVVTQISDAQLHALRQDKVFQAHEAGGFIIVDANEMDAESVAQNMTPRDKSAPKTPDDFQKVAGPDGEPVTTSVEKTKRK